MQKRGGSLIVVLLVFTLAFSIVTYAETDSDKDGIPDLWEKQHGLRFDIQDSRLDPDGDGLTNLEEYQQNSDPHNANQQQSQIIQTKTSESNFDFSFAPPSFIKGKGLMIIGGIIILAGIIFLILHNRKKQPASHETPQIPQRNPRQMSQRQYQPNYSPPLDQGQHSIQSFSTPKTYPQKNTRPIIKKYNPPKEDILKMQKNFESEFQQPKSVPEPIQKKYEETVKEKHLYQPQIKPIPKMMQTPQDSFSRLSSLRKKKHKF